MKSIFCILFISQVSLAAVKNQSFEEQVFISLRGSHEQSVATVKGLGKRALTNLKVIAFNEKMPMKTRWKSFMIFVEVSGKQSLPEIKKALMSKVWYMRSAGLTAMEVVSKTTAKKWAYQKLGSDPALMVRVKALEILQKSVDGKVTELFWKKLHSKDSFHQKQGLWIREDLAKQLLRKPRKKDLQRWVRLLHESDKKIQFLASQALNQLNPSGIKKSENVSYWQNKYPQAKSL